MIDTQKARKYGEEIINIADNIERLEKVRANRESILFMSVNGKDKIPLAAGTTGTIAQRVRDYMLREVTDTITENERALSEMLGNVNVIEPVKKKDKPSKGSC